MAIKDLSKESVHFSLIVGTLQDGRIFLCVHRAGEHDQHVLGEIDEDSPGGT